MCHSGKCCREELNSLPLMNSLISLFIPDKQLSPLAEWGSAKVESLTYRPRRRREGSQSLRCSNTCTRRYNSLEENWDGLKGQNVTFRTSVTNHGLQQFWREVFPDVVPDIQHLQFHLVGFLYGERRTRPHLHGMTMNVSHLHIES